MQSIIVRIIKYTDRAWDKIYVLGKRLKCDGMLDKYNLRTIEVKMDGTARNFAIKTEN